MTTASENETKPGLDRLKASRANWLEAERTGGKEAGRMFATEVADYGDLQLLSDEFEEHLDDDSQMEHFYADNIAGAIGADTECLFKDHDRDRHAVFYRGFLEGAFEVMSEVENE